MSGQLAGSSYGSTSSRDRYLDRLPSSTRKVPSSLIAASASSLLDPAVKILQRTGVVLEMLPRLRIFLIALPQQCIRLILYQEISSAPPALPNPQPAESEGSAVRHYRHSYRR